MFIQRASIFAMLTTGAGIDDFAAFDVLCDDHAVEWCVNFRVRQLCFYSIQLGFQFTLVSEHGIQEPVVRYDAFSSGFCDGTASLRRV